MILLSIKQFATLVLQFDITFHKMPCAWTSLDAMDISGEMHLDVVSKSLFDNHTSCTWTDTERHHFAQKPTGLSFPRKSETFCRTMTSTRSVYKQMVHRLMKASSTLLGQRTLTSCPKAILMKMGPLAAVVMVLKLLRNHVVIPAMR